VLALVLCLLAGACTSGQRYPARRETPPASAHSSSARDRTVLELSAAPWRLPAPLSRAVALPDGGGALLLGGLERSQASTDQVLHLDLARGTATPAGRLAAAVHDAAGAVLAGTAYVFGGGAQQTLADVQAVVPARIVGQLPQGLAHAAAVRLDGRIYLAGGRSGGRATNAVWRFDPAGGRVTLAGRLPGPVSDAAAVVAGGSAWLLGGENGTQLATVTVLRLATQPTLAGHARPAPAPFHGRLLIADRGNDRLLLVDTAKHVLWQYPSAGAPAPPGGFYYPTTPSSSATAPRSSPTRKATTPSSRSPSPAAGCGGAMGTPGSREADRAI
jgi:hypothetical protein